MGDEIRHERIVSVSEFMPTGFDTKGGSFFLKKKKIKEKLHLDKAFLLKSVDKLYFGTVVCLFLRGYGLDRGIDIFVFHFLLRTSCLFYRHFYFPVGRTTHDSKKTAQLYSAAESIAIV